MNLKLFLISTLKRLLILLGENPSIIPLDKRTKQANVSMSASGTISINGKRFKGKNVTIINNEVYIDNVKQNVYEQQIKIVIEGNCEVVETQSGDVVIQGRSHTITTSNGNVNAFMVSGDITTVNGNVTCKDVSGSVKTVNGSIQHNS